MPTTNSPAAEMAHFGPSFGTLTPVPVPGALILLAAGVLGLGGAARLRSRRAR
ncbi:MAG: hypothetical protein ABW020_17070 [Candidatus Rokuibacteriota bacterium]